MTHQQLKQLICISCCLLLLIQPISGDSLWRANSMPNIYGSPQKALRVGDVITVYISEKSSAAQEASTRTTKESELNTDFLSGWDQVANLLGNEMDRRQHEFEVRGENNYEGLGQTARKSKVQAVVTAIVTEVLESGNVFIVGERKVKVNNEIETIRVSGIVRPADIRPDNSLFSYQIAKVQVSVNGDGVVAEKQTPGILTNMLNWFF